MAPHTTLGVGGPADYFVDIANEDELCCVMRYVHTNELPWMVVGDGTNLLVSDKGIRGVVLHLAGELMSASVDGTTLRSGAGARISTVADLAAKHNLAGIEGVGTVPGTVGGAVVMNAGTHRGYIDVVTESVTVVHHNGEKEVFGKEACGFTYRNSRFQKDKSLIVASARFTLEPGNGTEIQRHLDKVRAHRLATQPPGKSAGCFFKNLECASAGKLIEQSGCKGMREGGAGVSEIHANFIMNVDNATATDLFNLAERVRAIVLEKHGVALEYEVRRVGEW